MSAKATIAPTTTTMSEIAYPATAESLTTRPSYKPRSVTAYRHAPKSAISIPKTAIAGAESRRDAGCGGRARDERGKLASEERESRDDEAECDEGQRRSHVG